MSPEQVLKRPILLTEKAHKALESNSFVFQVNLDANKIQIREAVQQAFKVTVTDVRTLIFRGKDRRMGRSYAKRPNWKKAIVTLKAGDKIDFFDETPESPKDAG
jgi:large subunit ribosomal protein L23